MSEPPVAETARDRILRIAREVQQLSRTEMSTAGFLPQFLQRVGVALGASAGAVWMRDARGDVRLEADWNWTALIPAFSAAIRQAHPAALAAVFSNGQTTDLILPRDETLGRSPGVLLFAGLNTAGRCLAVVEMFIAAQPSAKAREGYLQFLEQMAAHAAEFLANTSAADAEPRAESTTRPHNPSAGGDNGVGPQTAPPRQPPVAHDAAFWAGFSEMLLQLQASRTVSEAASAAANDGRTLIGVDRCCVLRRRGRKLVVEAVSGLDRVNPRSNQMQALVRLVSSVLETGEEFAFEGSSAQLPQHLEEPLAEYVVEGGLRTLLVLPLFEPPPPVDPEQAETAPQDRRRRPFGAWVVERRSAEPMNDAALARARFLTDHIAAALFQADAYERILFRKLWLRLGRMREWLYGRKLLKLAAALAGVGVLIGVLTLVPWTYHVIAEGRLLPVVQRAVFAPWDGEVDAVFVKSGEAVEAGQPLARIWNAELHAQLVAVRSELNQKRQEQLSLEVQIDQAAQNVEKHEELRLRGELRETLIRIRGLKAQEAILAERESRLTVLAPITGTVATFQLEQLLANRPVQRGEMLLEVMDESGPWRLEVDIEEHRLHHLLQARRQAKRPLTVEYILATAPEETYTGEVDRLATRPRVDSERGSVLPVHVALREDPGRARRIGAEVRARIDCGRRSLGYVLFGDVIEFLQRKFWL